ncbi:MAG: DUF4176 domain-containing protein [Mycoplasmatales bacterium]
MKDILPLGSVVTVKKGDGEFGKLVIIGRGLKKDGKVFDYAGAIFPFGFVSDDSGILFQSEAIVELIHEGYLDYEEHEYAELLVKELNEIKQAN